MLWRAILDSNDSYLAQGTVYNNIGPDRLADAKARYPNYCRQSSLWLDDLASVWGQGILTTHTINVAHLSSSSYNFNLFGHDAVWAEHRTYHLRDTDWMRYVSIPGTLLLIKIIAASQIIINHSGHNNNNLSFEIKSLTVSSGINRQTYFVTTTTPHPYPNFWKHVFLTPAMGSLLWDSSILYLT